MLKVSASSQFKKDLKKLSYTKNLCKLEEVLNLLAAEEQLPTKYKDHQLKGNLKNYRECHIEPDWLLIYQIRKDLLILSLIRTGTHSELLKL